MQAPDPIHALWEAVFGQHGLSNRVTAVERDTENNGDRLDRMNSKLDKLMLLLLSSGFSIVCGLLYLILQGRA